MKARPFVIISGIGPGPTGTGMVMRGLMDESTGMPDSIRFLYGNTYRPLKGMAKRWERFRVRSVFPLMARLEARRRDRQVLLMHPQTLGMSLFRDIVETRDHTWMYVLDAYVFCRRSYNCLPREAAPCLKCVGNDGAAADQHACHDDFKAGPLQAYIRDAVARGKLGLVAQCETHALLLGLHFGPAATIRTAHLHVPDLDVVQGAPASRLRPLAVFHGNQAPAKGLRHVIGLAAIMPDWDFLVPCGEDDFRWHFPDLTPTPNVRMQSMSWSTGLEMAVRTADAVLCPSSWSAPVEGAVLKSLAHNGAVVLWPHDTAFAREIPDTARIDLYPEELARTASDMRLLIRDPARAARLRHEATAVVRHYIESHGNMLSALQVAIAGSGGRVG